MPSIKYKGFEIHFDTLEEAIAAVDRLGGSPGNGDDGKVHSGAGRSSVIEGRWTVSRFKDFVGRLTKVQAQMLQELTKTPHGRTAKDMAQALGLDTAKAFGPMLGAMSRHAKGAGIGFNEVMTSDRIAVGRDKILEFKATSAFLKIAAEAGWKVGE